MRLCSVFEARASLLRKRVEFLPRIAQTPYALLEFARVWVTVRDQLLTVATQPLERRLSGRQLPLKTLKCIYK